MPTTVQVRILPDSAGPQPGPAVEKPIGAFLYDLSEYGVGLVTNVSLPWGTHVELAFPRSALPLADRGALTGTMQMTGRVVHSMPDHDHYRVGISFTRMEESDRVLIRQLLTPQLKPDDRRRAPRALLAEGSGR